MPRLPAPDRSGVWHTVTRLGDANGMYVVAVGRDIIDACADMLWGDRVGKVREPHGHTRASATHHQVSTNEDTASAMGS
jgi:uncharacterized glyoxalase superfamily protein PhnB